jgi:hypothetical protein
MSLQRVLAVLCLLATTGASSAPGAHADAFRPDGRYDPRVPSPASVLGFEPGDRPARYETVMRYAEALAAASPNVRLQRYARSHEGRDLFVIIVSSEANLARLDAIRADLARLADPRPAMAPAAVSALIEQTPAVAYMAYAIHGDELSSTDAALRVAYELAAGENDDTRALREGLVVLIDPMENPDGRERMLAMTTAYEGAVPNPDPDALSHSGFWPWGRGNHYLFDLNRDWFALVHPESRGRAGILRTWRPQLTVDSHEMGLESTYLFSPPRDPFNPNLPSKVRDWSERFAADQARAFDRRGWSYFTREWNEEIYPGYGSSIAMYQGAIGILYEQSGTDGQPIRKPSGRVVSYEETVAHQYTSSMANLTTAATHRRELLLTWRDARAEAVARGTRGRARAFYIVPWPDPARAERLATRLAMLGVEVERLEAPGSLDGARSFWDGGVHAARLPAGAYRVRLDQPDGLLVRAVLEPHTPMPDSSLAEEREHLERQKGTRVYDVTAWSPLLASGLEAWWTPALDGLRWARVAPGQVPVPSAGGIAAGPPTYGWVFDGSADAALVLAARLTAAGFAVRAGEKPLSLGASALPRGSFLLRAEENPPAAAESLQSMARRAGVAVSPVAGARIPGGPDLGGDYWHLLQPARIAILAGASLDFSSVGWAWNLIDRESAVRVSLLDIGRVADTDLARYNVLVMPNCRGGAEAYRRALGAGGLRVLRGWVQGGGTLIALNGGAEFVAEDSTRLSAVRLRSQALKDFPPAQLGLSEDAIRGLERMQGMGLGPGAKPVTSWGPYEEMDRGRALGIPGPGSPLLGPGTCAWLGIRVTPAPAPPAPRGAAAKEEKGPSDEERQKTLARADARLRRFMPSGAVLRVDLDPEHWLAYGCGDRAAALTSGDDALLARDPAVTVGRYAAPGMLHLGGLLWPEAAGRIAQTAYLTREASGRGQVILFAGDPNFRGYFWGTERLFLNAALLGPGLGATHTIPW